MFLNTRGKSHDLLFYETLERRCELTSVEKSWFKTFQKGFEGECLYDDIFEDVGHDDVLVYRDLYLKLGKSVTQYDALVINDDGIVVNEIKNYTGDYKVEGGDWFRNGQRISEAPLAQLNRAVGKLIGLKNSVNGQFGVSGKLIFVSDDFYLQTDDNSLWPKIVVRMDLRRYLRKFRGGKIGNKSQFIIRLLSENIVENPYIDNNVDEARLRKGIYCGQCGSFSLIKSRFHLVCSECGSKESNETHLLRAMNDYQFLFYGKPMTRTAFMNFIGHSLTPRVVYRLLLKHCSVDKKGNQTAYIFKYQNFEDAMEKSELFIKYKDHLKG